MKPFLTCSAFVLLVSAAHAQSGATPTLPQVIQVIERLAAADSIAEVEQLLRANSGVATHAGTEQILAGALSNTQLTDEQRTIVSLANETFRDARAGGVELAAETLGVRVTLLELMRAETPADAKAVLVKRRDVTSSIRHDAAFERLRTQPGVDAAMLREMRLAFQESVANPDTAVDRLVRMANGTASAPAAPAGATPALGAAAPLVGHWRCTTILGGGDASMVTDYHMVLNADGTFRSWSRTMSSFSGESTTAPEIGQWALRGTSLVFTSAGGESEVPFRRSGDTILLPNESSRRVWERVQ